MAVNDEASPWPEGCDKWDQMTGESDEQYARFLWFRDQCETRQLRDVAKHYDRPIRTIHDWSTLYKWTDRAAAWDIHRGQLVAEAMQREHQRLVSQHLRAAAKMWERVEQRLETLSPGALTPREMIQLAEAASKIQVTATELAKSITRPKMKTMDGEGDAMDHLLAEVARRNALKERHREPVPRREIAPGIPGREARVVEGVVVPKEAFGHEDVA